MTTFSEDYSLFHLNTFGLQATARYWACFSSAAELADTVAECSRRNLPWYVLSGGSNLILTGNFPGAVLHPVLPSDSDGIEVIARDEESVLVRAEGAVVWDDLVGWAVEQGFGGLENLSLIPGYVGAAPVQNIGAYGSEAKDTIEWVEYFDTRTMDLRRLTNAECRFGYRESIFKQELRGVAIVTAVAFRLAVRPTFCVGYGDLHTRVEALGGATLATVRRAVIEIREAKLPDPAVTGNAGSFFKNPVISEEQAATLRERYPEIPSYAAEGGVKIPAAWLIDRAGWKGFRCGTVGVHPNQALVLINLGGATAQEILTLARRIICDVEKRFGVTISMEVNVL